jgi:hypothetical protein
MPIRPDPIYYYCIGCDWRCVEIPRSDALMIHYTECARCQSRDIHHRKASTEEIITEKLLCLILGH